MVRFRFGLVCLCFSLGSSFGVVRAQTNAAQQPSGAQASEAQPATTQPGQPQPTGNVPRSESQPKDPKAKKLPFSLAVTQDHIIGLSLTAKDAKLSDVAAELSRQLKIPVQLSPVMSKQFVTVDFRDLVLEASLQLLAPEVYIDYQIDSVAGTLPKPLGIFLGAYNEPPPATNAVVQGKSQAIVISGNTEEDPSEEDEDLSVTYELGKITVKAKDQPLVDVLFRIAETMGIPLEADDALEEKVTVNIIKTPIEDAILQLGPNIRLFVRADLQRAYRRPLRIILVPTDKRS